MRSIISMLLVTAASLQAQYQIDWSASAAGSGRQTGGVFSVSGSVGHASSSTAGGVYSVTIGFWSLDVLQPLAGPRLAIERRPEGIRVSWPLAQGDGFLEETDTLEVSPVPWQRATYALTTNGATVFVTIPVPPGAIATPAAAGNHIQIPARKVVRFRKR